MVGLSTSFTHQGRLLVAFNEPVSSSYVMEYGAVRAAVPLGTGDPHELHEIPAADH